MMDSDVVVGRLSSRISGTGTRAQTNGRPGLGIGINEAKKRQRHNDEPNSEVQRRDIRMLTSFRASKSGFRNSSSSSIVVHACGRTVVEAIETEAKMIDPIHHTK